MADITIRLVYNLKTGKKDIFIDLISDEDTLPIEHEKHHRQVVQQLLGKGILREEEVGEVKVSRVEPQAEEAAGTREQEEPPGQQLPEQG